MEQSEPMQQGRLPLAVLVDRLAGEARRNEDFARSFSRWFHLHAAHLHLAPLDALGLVDVVLTFRLRKVVTLVATGRHPQHPGEVTVRFTEQDFPFIDVVVDRQPRDDPYEVCTMDHSVQGRPVELLVEVPGPGGAPLPPQTRGSAVVHTTIGANEHIQLRLEEDGRDELLNLHPSLVRFRDVAGEASH